MSQCSPLREARIRGQMMKLLVINLAKDTDRLAAAREKFAELGLTFEHWPGVDGRALSTAELQTFAASRPRDGKYVWSPGKIGCFLSHFSAWKYCAEGSDPYIAIFEDDLYLSPELPHFLSDTCWLPQDFDIIRMESPTNRVKAQKNENFQFRGRDILRLRSTAWCAGSYILSKQGAKKLLSVPEKFHHNPDRLMFCYEDSVIAKQLATYQVAPSLAIQDKYFHARDDQVFQSNIETPADGSTDRIGLAEKIRHLSFAEIARFIKKTFLGYKRVPFKL